MNYPQPREAWFTGRLPGEPLAQLCLDDVLGKKSADRTESVGSQFSDGQGT